MLSTNFGTAASQRPSSASLRPSAKRSSARGSANAGVASKNAASPALIVVVRILLRRRACAFWRRRGRRRSVRGSGLGKIGGGDAGLYGRRSDDDRRLGLDSLRFRCTSKRVDAKDRQ